MVTETVNAEDLLAEALAAGFPPGWMRGRFNDAAWHLAAEKTLAASPQLREAIERGMAVEDALWDAAEPFRRKSLKP